jgi:hypothetical protein
VEDEVRVQPHGVDLRAGGAERVKTELSFEVDREDGFVLLAIADFLFNEEPDFLSLDLIGYIMDIVVSKYEFCRDTMMRHECTLPAALENYFQKRDRPFKNRREP